MSEPIVEAKFPRVWVYSLKEGDVQIRCPQTIPADEVADLLDYLDLVRKQIARYAWAVPGAPEEQKK